MKSTRLTGSGFVTRMTTRVKPSMGCGYVVASMIGLAGGGLLAVGWHHYGQAGDRVTAPVAALGGVGVVLIAAAAAYLRFSRRTIEQWEAEERIRAAHPDQPWKWKPEWQRDVIESGSAANVWMLWFFAVVWNGLSAPGVWFLFTAKEPEKAAYLILMFPLIGVGLLAGAIYKTVQWWKFGRARLRLSTVPGAIGGYLGGVIEVPARVDLESDARITLRNVRRVTSGSGKNRSTRETVLWEHEERIAPEKWITAAGHTDIPVLFHIPEGRAATNVDDSDDQTVWRLSASAAVPGVDFETTFDVPVFVTGETAPPPEAGAPLLEQYKSGPPDLASLREAGVIRTASGYQFSGSHLWGTRIISTMLAVGLLVLLGSFFSGEGVHWVVWVVTSMFGLGAVLVALDLWSDKFELRRVGDEVVVLRRRFWGRSEVRLSRRLVAEIRVENSMGVGTTQYQRLVLVGRGGVDPVKPGANEPFRLRKLRYRLKRLGKELGVNEPEKMGERGRQILTQMAQAPVFEVTIAKHIPGETFARRVGAMVLADLQRGI